MTLDEITGDKYKCKEFINPRPIFKQFKAQGI